MGKCERQAPIFGTIMEKVNLISIDTLMSQTRALAANYYKTTQQTLPVSHELAKYDAIRLMNLIEASPGTKGVDACAEGIRYQIKSRVCFNPQGNSYRIGQLNLEGAWDTTLLVLLNEEYEPMEILSASREVLQEAIGENPVSNRMKRGILSVAKFKAIGTCVWSRY